MQHIHKKINLKKLFGIIGQTLTNKALVQHKICQTAEAPQKHETIAVQMQSYAPHSSTINGVDPVAQGGTRQSGNQAARQATNLSVNPSTQQILLL